MSGKKGLAQLIGDVHVASRGMLLIPLGCVCNRRARNNRITASSFGLSAPRPFSDRPASSARSLSSRAVPSLLRLSCV
jgi:hypothetical protein